MDYFNDLNIAITICDKEGKVVYLNQKAKKTFQKDDNFIGENLKQCHSDASWNKLLDLIKNSNTNAYTIEKNGIKKLIYQTPWYNQHEIAGIIEFSFELPDVLPHFKRT